MKVRLRITIANRPTSIYTQAQRPVTSKRCCVSGQLCRCVGMSAQSSQNSPPEQVAQAAGHLGPEGTLQHQIQWAQQSCVCSGPEPCLASGRFGAAAAHRLAACAFFAWAAGRRHSGRRPPPALAVAQPAASAWVSSLPRRHCHLGDCQDRSRRSPDRRASARCHSARTQLPVQDISKPQVMG